MMFSIRRPSRDLIDQLIASERAKNFTYAEVGASQHAVCPTGFRANRFGCVLGGGEALFDRARAAMRELVMLDLAWLQLAAPLNSLEPGAIICTQVHLFGLYSLNVGRVSYVEDEASCFAFGYGTLPQYPVRGEERFSLRLDSKSGEVCFEIFSFARAKNFLMGLGWPAMKIMQRRFCHECSERLRSHSSS